MNLSRLASAFLITGFIVIFLIYAKNLLIPFVLALFIWFIIREIRKFIRRNKFIRNRIPNWLANIISSLILFVLLGVFVSILTNNIQQLSIKMPLYEKNIQAVTTQLNEAFNINIYDQLHEYSGGIKFRDVLSEIINSVSTILGDIFIILIYILFLFLEESGFHSKFVSLFKNENTLKSAEYILDKIDFSIGRYIGLKTLVSFLTGFLSYIALLIIGVDAALFWAFLIFTLNYIPTIGSLIATLFPTIFALLQYGTLGPAIWVMVIVSGIQLIIGNYVEPKIMGSSLNLSALVVILALSLWGAIWGIVGMVLSVPITVIMLILFSEFPATRNIAILLSEKGKIDE